ncbi:MAG: hypothetical protein JWM27_161, partial [Gemmatimonadetes bacterium]|nr:hypothetical protein [Gemmatimonadota bacterium]
AAALPDGDASLRAQGPVGAGELAATVAYARKVRGRFRVGAGAKLVQERLGGAQDAGWAVDLGAAARVGPATVGLAARDLGPALEIGGARARLPARVTLGATLRRQEVGPLDVTAAAEATRLAGGRLVPAAGVEVGYWPVVGRTVAARAGVRRGVEGEGARVTLGGGMRWDRLSIDYAWQGLDGAGSGAAHRVGLTWR